MDGSDDNEHFLYQREQTKKGTHGYINSGRSNHKAKAKKFGQELKDMPQYAFRVWYGMRNFEVKKNYINARFREIADFCGLAVSAVHKAMHYMEEHDLIVRVSEPGRKALWMINPTLQWNWERELQPGGLATYRKEKREAKKREEEKKKVQESSKSLTQAPISNDIINEPSEYIEQPEKLNESQDRGSYRQKPTLQCIG